MKWVWCLMALGVVGCAHGLSMGIAKLDGDLPAAAARDLECPSDQITFESIEGPQRALLTTAGGPPHAYAHGCGKRLAYAHMCHPGGTDCDWYSVKKLRIDSLLSRVSFEAKCAKEQVQTTQVAPDTVGVDACGSRMTYLWSCPHNPAFFSPACTWVLNSDSKREQPALSAH